MNVMIVANGVPTEEAPLLGIFEFDQAMALTKHGHKVTLFAVDLRSIRHKRKYGISRGRLNGVDWIRYDFPMGRLPHCLFRSVGIKALRKMYETAYPKQKPDVIHSHFLFMGEIANTLARDKGIKHVLTEHSSTLNAASIDPKVLKIARSTYSSADKVIAVSTMLADNIKLNTSISAVVVPNIIHNIDMFDLEKIKYSGFRFVTTCGLIHRKRPDMLLKAFASVHQKHPDTYLTFIGDGPMKKELTAQVEKLGLSDCVTFHGVVPRERIAEIYRECDCFVLPSSLETFGVAYVEALASGIPVIATKCGGPEDFVRETNGVLIETDNIDELISSMNDMYSHRDRYDPDMIRQTVHDAYSDDTVSAKITEIYEKLVYSSTDAEQN